MKETLPEHPVPLRVVRRASSAGSILTPAGGRHLIVIHASRATWTVCRETGQRHLRRRGHVDVIPAGTTGGFDAESASRSVLLSLAPEMLGGALGRSAHRTVRLEPQHMLERPRIVRLAAALQADDADAGHADQMFLEAMAQAVASQLVSFTAPLPPERQKLAQRQVTRLLELIEGRLDSRLTIDMLAREIGASSSALRHWFGQTQGASIHRYIMRRRVARARQLLERGGLPLSQIAHESGFAHQSHMARWLRREMGQAPLSLRRAASAAGR